MQGDLLNDFKSKPPVKRKGILIGTAHVKPGNISLRPVKAREFSDNACSVASATMRGMRAHPADFRIARKHQALSAHGNQLAIVPDPEVAAHLVGTRTKETGKGQIRKRDHFKGIFGTERNYAGTQIRQRHLIGEDHLKAFERPLAGEFRDLRVAFSHQPQRILWFEQAGEVSQRSIVRGSERGERRNIGRVAAGAGV